MRVWELIKETYFRSAFIRIIHISWLAIYCLLYLIPHLAEMGFLGPMLFGWSGCLLPILLSAGIFGTDIVSGRISILVTKPLQSIELYMCRLIGLSLQCALTIAISGLIMLVLQMTNDRGRVENLGLWMLAAWLISNTWLALSTSLSVIIRREHNSALLILITIACYFLVACLMNFVREDFWAIILLKTVRYACPPVEFLIQFAQNKAGLAKATAYVIHVFGLTAVYSAVGIILLYKREFRSTRD